MRVRSTVRAALCVAVLGVVVPYGAADAARPRPDRTPPTAPADFRVTGVTQTSVSFAWSPSTDNVGVRSYTLWGEGMGGVVSVDHPTTAATVSGLHPGQTIAFEIAAYDGINVSAHAGPLTVTTRADTSAPSTPTDLTVHAVQGSSVQLRWSALTDDHGPVRYRVLVDGVATPNTMSINLPGTFPPPPTQGVWVRQLEPGTTYRFSVQAIDSGGNASGVTAPVSATTAPNADTVAPTTPTLTSVANAGTSYCPEELGLRWTASTDDVDPATAIEYEVRINGVITEVAVGFAQHIAYTDVRGPNTVTITAVDRAGNASAPSNAITENVDWGAGCGT